MKNQQYASENFLFCVNSKDLTPPSSPLLAGNRIMLKPSIKIFGENEILKLIQSWTLLCGTKFCYHYLEIFWKQVFSSEVAVCRCLGSTGCGVPGQGTYSVASTDVEEKLALGENITCYSILPPAGWRLVIVGFS